MFNKNVLKSKKSKENWKTIYRILNPSTNTIKENVSKMRTRHRKIAK